MTPVATAAMDAQGISRWRLIRDALAADLDRGAPEPGGRLASEGELARRFAVNRHTVRRALSALAEEGRIRIEHGKGSFAARPPVRYRIGAETSFTANLAAAGRIGRRVVVGLAEVRADAGLARRLRLLPGAPLVRAHTRTFVDDVPFATSEHHFAADRIPGIAAALAEGAGISRALAACGIDGWRRASTDIHARPATPEEAAVLALGPREPVLVTAGLDTTADGAPLQWVVATFAASRVELATISS